MSAPDPIAHAAPDAELAAAQVALGTPPVDELGLDVLDERGLEELAGSGERGIARALEHESIADEPAADRPPASGRRRERAQAGAVAVGARAERAPARSASPGARLVTFLRGSWAELQRVQWPDRRQVAQATGVVIGFVIVAGVFLGLSDLASSHLMDWLLK